MGVQTGRDREIDNKPLLIVTGSSAGGIEALRSLLAGMPRDLRAPIVVAQHLDPTHESRLQQILAQDSKLPVKVATHRTRLAEGTIYVIPPNRDVAIEDHQADVFLVARAGVKPSIDRLFSTAAEYYGDRLIAIILSGMGSDGLAGARSVKEHGGVVIVQEPASASHPNLPRLIPPSLVDITARPEDIGSLIEKLHANGEASADSKVQATLRGLLDELRDRTGIDFQQYKLPTVLRRLSRLTVANNAENLHDFLEYLHQHPEGYQRLASAFLIKVTQFFRDEELFNELKAHVLPHLIAEAKKDRRELRIWSAGASTGEEAYSLAILCCEILREAKGDDQQVRIFATDLDEEAIAFARRALYSDAVLRDAPQKLVERYFTRVGESSYEVSKRVRNMVVLGQHDLAQRAPFPRIDLCMCRNVLIYFTKELQARALQLFAFSLRDHGYLILGKAESTTPLPQYFESVNSSLKLYRRVGARIPMPPKLDIGISFAQKTTLAPLGVHAAATESRSRADVSSPEEIAGEFMFESAVGIAVVDRRYDIRMLNPAARAMLQIHGVGVGEDLIHSAQNIDRNRLRNLIDDAFRGEKPQPANFETFDEQERRRVIKVQCLYEAGSAHPVEGAAIVMLDVTEEATRHDEAERRYTEESRKLTNRIAELSLRQKNLLTANDELTGANTELRATNERLILNTEEAAASHEEIEILNEEMQATNEELETLNEELQATVEELNTTTDEMQSRITDLEQERDALLRQKG